MTEVIERKQDSGGDAAPGIDGPDHVVWSGWKAVVAGVDEAIVSAQSAWRGTVDDEVVRPLRLTISGAIAAVAPALAELERGLAAASTSRLQSQAVGGFRAAIEGNAIARLGQHLRDEQPGERLSLAYQNLLRDLADEVERIPESMEFEEAGEALKRRPGDGLLLRFRKLPARMGHRSKEVPARALVSYHLEIRVPRAFSSRHEAAQRSLAHCLKRLERATSKFTHEILEIEERLAKRAPVGQTGNDQEDQEDQDFQEEKSAEVRGNPSELDPTEVKEAVRSIADVFVEMLQTALEGVSGLEPLPAAMLDDLASFFDYDAKSIGTFLLSLSGRSLPGEGYLPTDLALQLDSEWIEFQKESQNRIQLNQHLLRIRSTLGNLFGSILDHVSAATVEPIRDATGRLSRAIAGARLDLEKLLDAAARSSHAHDELAAELQSISARAIMAVQTITQELGGVNAADQALRDLGLSEWEESRKRVDLLQSRIKIHAVDLDEDIPPSLHRRRTSVDLSSIVKEVLGLRFAEQLRRPAKILRRTVVRQWGNMANAAEVIAFGSEAAAEALINKGDDGLADARKFAVDGLSRAREQTDAILRSLDKPWSEFTESVLGVMSNIWLHIHRRVRTVELDADQWADMGSRFSVAAQSWWITVRRRSVEVVEHVSVWFRFGRQKTNRLIRLGQSAVGVSEVAEGSTEETIDAILHFSDVQANMPLVYRRLFTLKSLTEPTFLENRAADAAFVGAHFERWHSGSGSSALILASPLGSGRTSFLNSLDKLVFSDAFVRSVRFDRRLRTEAEVVHVLASAFDLKVGNSPTFDDLHDALSRAYSRTESNVCCIHDLEHVVFAVPGGVELFKSLLVFFSRSDHMVYWIGAIGELCYQFVVETTTTTGLAKFHMLREFDRASLEAVILNRHRRSGMEIRFDPPPSQSTIMRQRLRRAESEEDRQEIIRQAFFERLARHADQNLRLAIFYWVRSLEFDDENDIVHVRWLQPLDFSFLSQLDVRRSFSLRSFLFHRTLTLEEHALIFRMSDSESTLILESLFNTGLLTPYPFDPDETVTRVEAGRRYQIHPLLIGPVRSQLVGRHFIY